MLTDQPSFTAIAAALGDPVRARIVDLLMDGRARTATELALAGGVAPSTASVHLARLLDAGVLARVASGRHRYFAIADSDVAAAVETLMVVSPQRPPAQLGTRDPALRAARSCFDHLAGELGVRLASGLCAAGHLRLSPEAAQFSASGERWLLALGIDPSPAPSAGPRVQCRPCLDFSERRLHLAGAVAANILKQLLARDWLRRTEGSRALQVRPGALRLVDGLAGRPDACPGLARD